MFVTTRTLHSQLKLLVPKMCTLTACTGKPYSGRMLDHIVTSPVPQIEIPNVNLQQYIWSNMSQWADKIAVECVVTGRKYSYTQCFEHSNSVTNFTRTLGLRKGDTIAILALNVPEYILVVLGCIQAGLRVSPINPGYTAEEVKRQLIDSNAKLLFTLNNIWSTAQSAVQGIPANIPIVVIRQEQAESLPSGAIKFDDIIATPARDTTWEEVELNDDVLLPYSSGTTGLPKGVQLSHRNVVANHIQAQTKEVQFIQDTTATTQDVVPVILPMYHMYGLGVIALPLFSKGVKLITIPKFSSKVFLTTLINHKPNLLYAAPPIVLMFLNNADIKKVHMETLRTTLCGAAPLGATDIQRFQEKCNGKVDLLQLYGLSETSPITHMQTANLPNCVKLGGSGIPVANTECKIVRADDDSQTPLGLGPNQSGELLIRGPQIMKGYHKNPESTKKSIIKDGWLRTGDIAHYDDDGHFFITDRLKELIKVSGYQVAPAELEEILRGHPAISDAAVIGVPHARSGEAPKAFVVLKPTAKGEGGAAITAKDIETFVGDKVAKHKQLMGGVHFLNSIPKNPSGKILRRELKLIS